MRKKKLEYLVIRDSGRVKLPELIPVLNKETGEVDMVKPLIRDCIHKCKTIVRLKNWDEVKAGEYYYIITVGEKGRGVKRYKNSDNDPQPTVPTFNLRA